MSNSIPTLDPDNPANFYCAGLFEGEGSIRSYQQRDKYNSYYAYIGLSVDMTDLEPLELFEDIMQVGKIYGPYYRTNKEAKPIYRYYVASYQEVKYVVDSIYGWLSTRRKLQCDTALSNYLKYKELNPNTTTLLSKDQIEDIRLLWSSSKTKILAERFNVSTTTIISVIKRRGRYKNI